MAPTRVMFDSNIHDAVASDEIFAQLIKQDQSAGCIVVQSTHIQQTEIAAIPAEKDIGQALARDTQRIGPSVLVWNHSRWGEDRWGTPESNATFAKLQIGNPKHTEDAMIGATALTDADILVTNDGRFRKRFEKLGSGVKVMSATEFTIFLTGLLS